MQEETVSTLLARSEIMSGFFFAHFLMGAWNLNHNVLDPLALGLLRAKGQQRLSACWGMSFVASGPQSVVSYSLCLGLSLLSKQGIQHLVHFSLLWIFLPQKQLPCVVPGRLWGAATVLAEPPPFRLWKLNRVHSCLVRYCMYRSLICTSRPISCFDGEWQEREGTCVSF